MNFSLYIAKRYLISKSKNNAINTISRIAALGIVVSSLSLFVVLSVFSGLRDFSLSFTHVLQPDLTVYPAQGKSLTLTPHQYQQLTSIKDISVISTIIEEKVLLFYNDKECIATLKGVDSNYTQISAIKDKIYIGEWLNKQSPQVVIGSGIAYQLSVGLYDYTNVFQLYMPKPGKGQISNPDQAFNKQNVIPAGIYSINEELDNTFVFCSLELAQSLVQYKPQQFSSLEIKLQPTADEAVVREQIETFLKQPVILKNKLELNSALNKMLNTENMVVYLIFTLVMIIALFNLIGSIIMMVLEKRKNLTTLFYIGVPLSDIRNIFLLHGILLSITSGVIGLFLGYGIVFLQEQYQFIMITASMPYPVKIEPINFVIVLLTSSSLGIIASQIASRVVTQKILT